MTPSIADIVRYALDLERAAGAHPAHARRLLAEAADTWFCLGRHERACALAGRLAMPCRGRPRRPLPVTCLRARSKA